MACPLTDLAGTGESSERLPVSIAITEMICGREAFCIEAGRCQSTAACIAAESPKHQIGEWKATLADIAMIG
jgi:hypothetical protein